MFKRKLVFLFAFILLSGLFQSKAQETQLEKGKEYILAGIEVTGKVSYNEQTVITFTELQVGSKIRIPGSEISEAVKKLWKLGLFNDVNFYVKKIEGDNIFLELNLYELPKLNEVKFKGLRKAFKRNRTKKR